MLFTMGSVQYTPTNEFLQKEESLRLSPYSCSKGKSTVGWGTRFYCNGDKVKMTDEPISRIRADIMFHCHLIKRVYPAIDKITLSLTENQNTALESFIYRHGMYSYKVKAIQRCETHECISDIIKKQPDVPNRALREWRKFNE